MQTEVGTESRPNCCTCPSSHGSSAQSTHVMCMLELAVVAIQPEMLRPFCGTPFGWATAGCVPPAPSRASTPEPGCARARAHPSTGRQHHWLHRSAPANLPGGFIEHHLVPSRCRSCPRRAGHCHVHPSQHLRARATNSGAARGSLLHGMRAPRRMASSIMISGLSAGGQHLFARPTRA